MKIRTRIFLLFALINAAGFYALIDWVQEDLRQRYMESLEEPLVDTAEVLAGIVAQDIATNSEDRAFPAERWHETFGHIYRRNLASRIYTLEKLYVDLRVYVTDTQGRVIFDSRGRAEGEDYSRWNDVLLTLRGEYGARATQDDPLFPKRAVLYVAAPVMVDGKIQGVLSVGKPTGNVDQFIEQAKRQITQAGWIAVVLMLLLALVLYRWVSRPLQRLTDYVEAVKRGERRALPELGRNEIGLMGEALESMRTALDGKAYVEGYVQTLTHEIKSPLAAIRGAAELMGEDMPVEQREHFLNNILRESARAQALVDRMLELAALESRKSLNHFEGFDLCRITKTVIEELRPLAEAKGIEVRLAAPGFVEIEGDPYLIAKAVSNLLNNAIAFSPRGGVVEVEIEQGDEGVTLRILDRGTGIPDYARDKLFDRFFSLQRPDSGEKSTGLGLSLVREIVELHGARVELGNREGGGCAVELVFGGL